ncbi:rRNA maturation RNase YbeY [Neobacillus piezotolerans]|uniref:Endoribonuclease YbeY n=1 Tax=Neobacillus piezotolerans TaxID=2259171 RepID=A0A3D8GMW6_9BACI|nr:rRNA maturation RNase YbeY [Neobacillus piezotolerans]RDU35416.1 rRNA maturation RNase YbeY [Neobacillus piezotolerans]
MKMIIDFLDETGEVADGDISQLESLLNYAGLQMNVEEGSEVSVTFVGNDRIQEINLEYRQKDVPTDVLSFPMEEPGEGEIEISGRDLPRVLGDIIISIPKTMQQAEEYGHSFMRELGFLAVHGFLHLLGYDHETEADEKEMFSLQKDILDGFGLTR